MTLNRKQQALCDANRGDFSDLSAIFINCTLQRPEEPSHTGLLMGVAEVIMHRSGVAVSTVRPTAHRIAFGV